LDHSTPTVTVVIPTFNRPSLLIRAVESAIRQTFLDLEVVVVIDGSDPATREALERVGDPRLRYVELEQKVGGSEARNVGAREAKGSWIALLDDDDEWLPHKLEKQLEAVQSAKGGSVVVTSQYICRASDAPDVVRPRRLPKPGESIAEFMFDYLCYFQTSTFLCSKELFLRVLFDRSLPFFQDIDWFLRISHEADFQLLVVAEPLSIYYMPAGRASITSATNWESRLEWGRSRRHLLSKRAYSRFIVGTCVGRAVQDGAGIKGFRTLLYEAVVVGSATPYLVALLCGGYILTPKYRKQLRDMLFFAKAKKVPTDRTSDVA
jgi:glycosyltransferase involved in cell wall biosynthesis